MSDGLGVLDSLLCHQGEKTCCLFRAPVITSDPPGDLPLLSPLMQNLNYTCTGDVITSVMTRRIHSPGAWGTLEPGENLVHLCPLPPGLPNSTPPWSSFLTAAPAWSPSPRSPTSTSIFRNTGMPRASRELAEATPAGDSAPTRGSSWPGFWGPCLQAQWWSDVPGSGNTPGESGKC